MYLSLLNLAHSSQPTWRLSCSLPMQSASRQDNLFNHPYTRPSLGCPWGAQPLIRPKPRHCFSIFALTSKASGCVGWCFLWHPTALLSSPSAFACGHPPTPSAPGAWPQPPRHSSFPHPTCVNISEQPPQLLLCWGSRGWFACCMALVRQSASQSVTPDQPSSHSARCILELAFTGPLQTTEIDANRNAASCGVI